MNKENNIDNLFRQAREQQPEASFNETKNLFLNALGSQKVSLDDSKKGKVLTFKNSIIMSTIIGFIALVSTLFFLQDSTKEKAEQKIVIQENTKNETEITKDKENTIENQFTTDVKLQETNVFNLNKIESKSFLNEVKKEAGLDNYRDLKEEENKIYNLGFVSKLDDEYVFPKLTEEEIQKTKKQKKKMLKALAKMDRDSYSYIPSGSFDYKGNVISVQAFYIQKTEVSNLEYRTYLFDLLINDKKDEFLKAKPNQHAWKIALGDSAQYMIDNYFSNKMYDNYPVNNISREGAELYCKWLSKELIDYVGEKDAVKYNDMRIPTRQEWVKAASVEGKFKNYPVENDSIYDKKINVFTANFNLKDKSNTIRKGGYKTEMDNKAGNYYTPINYFMKGINCYIAPCGFNFGEKTSYKMYQLTGNVAEMVIDCPNNIPKLNDSIPKQNRILTPGTAGGGWMNSAEEIKINAPDNHPNVIEAHPNIGFRVIMSHHPRSGYKYLH